MCSLWLMLPTLRTWFRLAAGKEADKVHFPYGCCAGGEWDSCQTLFDRICKSNQVFVAS